MFGEVLDIYKKEHNVNISEICDDECEIKVELDDMGALVITKLFKETDLEMMIFIDGGGMSPVQWSSGNRIELFGHQAMLYDDSGKISEIELLQVKRILIEDTYVGFYV
jgi:hypothetical protein